VVNRAARVTGAGHGGQILLSRATVEVLGPDNGIDLPLPASGRGA
jgi:class 3 adenylate cyclase